VPEATPPLSVVLVETPAVSRTRPRALVADDHPVMLSALARLARSECDVIGTARDGEALLREVRELRPDLVILDIFMPEMDGLQVQQELRGRGIGLPVVVMTGHGDVNVAVQAMKAGAVDFIEKPFEKAALLSAIEEGFARISQASRHSQRADEARVRLQALTPREHDVLEGLVRGHPNKTIAYDLGISPRTVEVHRANLMAKLQVRSLSEALRIAFAAGLGADRV